MLSRWFVQSVCGLLLTGFGLCLFGEANNLKAAEGSWFLLGTISLVVFQAGLCLMIDASHFRKRSIH